MTAPPVRTGIIGGSGFYSLFEGAESVTVDTPYGRPSAPVTLGELAGAPVAFLPRHGRKHEIPPHLVNYRANLWALKDLGCDAVVGPAAVGSLQPHIHPGEFVVCDQFVDRTWGRPDTFYEGPDVTHVSLADPYCPAMREAAVSATRAGGVTVHDGGTVVVVQGPRFSTRAESAWFSAMGWAVVSMTQYPEVTLARELEVCYVNLALVTDYDAGVPAEKGEGGVAAVSFDTVIEALRANNEHLRGVLAALVARVDPGRECGCRSALSGASHG